MNRKISRSQMAGINLKKNLQALIQTLPTNGKLKFDSNNIDLKSNHSNSSGKNNKYKYSYNNDNNNYDDYNSSNNNKVF